MPIEYAPQSWNPYSGCQHSLAQCPVADQCWARNMAGRFKAAAGGDFDPRFYPERVGEPSKWRKPRRVAVCFMGDLFGEWVNRYAIAAIQEVVRACPQHTFLFLTKHPSRLAEFNPWPSNAWVGWSAWDGESFRRGLEALQGVTGGHTWVSFEPLLGKSWVSWDLPLRYPEWVVLGGLQKGYQDVKLRFWVDDIEWSCRQKVIPYWEKNNLQRILGRKLRQDLPQVEGQ